MVFVVIMMCLEDFAIVVCFKFFGHCAEIVIQVHTAHTVKEHAVHVLKECPKHHRVRVVCVIASIISLQIPEVDKDFIQAEFFHSCKTLHHIKAGVAATLQALTIRENLAVCEPIFFSYIHSCMFLLV